VSDPAVRSGGVADAGAVPRHGRVEHHVVAAVLVHDGRVFLCHRAPDRRWYPDVWDLAGGHVETGEAPETALCRELAEELGITARAPIGPPVALLADTDDLRLAVYVVRDWEGDPANRAPEEHDAIGWFDEDGLGPLRLAIPELSTILRQALGTGAA
jgi:8-oxo-dGTP diphosphatase